MEKRLTRPMTPFDELVTPPQLHMLKLFLPYTPSSNQRFLGIFIKFLELKEAISFFQNDGKDLHTQAFQSSTPPSFMEIMQEIKPYMPSRESEMIDTFLNMMNIMEMAQMFQGSTDFQSDTASGETDGSKENMGGLSGMFSGGFNPMDLMMGMLTPDQQNMFQMYNDMFSGQTDTAPGDIPDTDTAPGDIPDTDTTGENSYAKNTPDINSYNEDTAGRNTADTDFNWKGNDNYERMDEPPGNEEY